MGHYGDKQGNQGLLWIQATNKITTAMTLALKDYLLEFWTENFFWSFFTLLDAKRSARRTNITNTAT